MKLWSIGPTADCHCNGSLEGNTVTTRAATISTVVSAQRLTALAELRYQGYRRLMCWQQQLQHFTFLTAKCVSVFIWLVILWYFLWNALFLPLEIQMHFTYYTCINTFVCFVYFLTVQYIFLVDFTSAFCHQPNITSWSKHSSSWNQYFAASSLLQD